MKEVDNSLGCLISLLVIALAIFIVYHGAEFAQLILGNCGS